MMCVFESIFLLSLGRKMAKEANKREKKGFSFSTYDLYGETSGVFLRESTKPSRR